MPYEKMRLQEAAEALAGEIDRVLARVRARAPRPAEHLERSADSVVFNIAEGIAAYRPAVKINAYDIARREANEIRAVLRRLHQKRALTPAELARPYHLAGACMAMLTNAIKAQEKRKG
jgi:four helix bundle protein